MKELKFNQCNAFECVLWNPRLEMLSLFNGKVTAFCVANRYTLLPINKEHLGTYKTYYWL
tara:strand:+ start:717 stop:896 length:180 start_codon:yes stop_codon:yes gene_type:complete